MQSRYITRSFFRFIYVHLRTSALFLSLVSIFLTPVMVSAQSNIQSKTTWPSLYYFSSPAYLAEKEGEIKDSNGIEAAPSLPLVIDTDPGVDDAVALAWLLSVTDADDVLGIVTVAGNTTVDNATQNINTLLAQMDVDSILVVKGADKPLVQKLSSRGMLVHGRDGLWGLQMEPTAIAKLQHEGDEDDHDEHDHDEDDNDEDDNEEDDEPSQSATEFYCTTATQSPGATILALGPLTNLAAAIQSCPDAMNSYARVVILGGAKHGGNTTPVAEFNFWQDPEAVDIVLASGMKLEIVPQDGFTQLTFDVNDLAAMSATSQQVIQYLLPAISIYLGTQLGAGIPAASIPDLAATIYAANGLGTSTSALVKVVTAPDALRGQSLMGVGFAERVMMITNDDELSEIAVGAFATSTDPVLPNASYVNTRTLEILMREPDNAGVVLEIDEEGMHMVFSNFLFDPTNLPEGGQPSQRSGDAIFLPFVNGN